MKYTYTFAIGVKDCMCSVLGKLQVHAQFIDKATVRIKSFEIFKIVLFSRNCETNAIQSHNVIAQATQQNGSVAVLVTEDQINMYSVPTL